MKQRILWVLGSLAVLCAAVWLRQTAAAIERQSNLDEAQKADIIIVLGAAEYRGRPSPVFEARLNHALILYLRKLAPRVLTTGGAGGDRSFTEGDVGREYLSRRGVPSEAILVTGRREHRAFDFSGSGNHAPEWPCQLHRGQ